MKYIRTKDNLVGERIYINDIPEPQNDKEREILKRLRKNIGQIIIKQADTIEELCDSEVIVWNDSTPSTWNKFLTKQEFEHLYSSFQRKKIIAIYGAIWTDKGLIYVAKMNEKGEFKLL